MQSVEPTQVLPRRWLTYEIWLVFGVSLGAAGVTALLRLADSLTRGDLPGQHATLNSSLASNSWIDLSLQVAYVVIDLVPVLLALYLLLRSRESPRVIGLDTSQPARDLRFGALLAAVVGGTGLAFYLLTHALGADLTVVAEDLPAVWWRYPVLLLQAAHDGLLEEILVVGFLLHRLRQLGWSQDRSLVVSAVLRGSYHLYQGFGGFAGNLVMGLLFGRIYQRYGRVLPLVIAHSLIDAVAFCGYAALAGHVSWLPT